MPFRRYFQKGGDRRTHHVHVYESGNSEIERHLKFRDWMRTHVEDRQSYANLKQDLAKQFPNDTMAYCLGKEQFITSVDKKAGFLGLRIVQALSPREWDAVRHFRQHYFFDKLFITDPYTWTFDHEAHVHFVLYLETDIIGYAHSQLWSKARAALRIIVIDENHRNQAYGQKLLLTCERWLKTQGYQSLHVESSPQALGFYRKNNYEVMPFNDPDGYEGHPEDTAVGKVLV